MTFVRFPSILLLFGLLISIPGSSNSHALQYPRWLYGATGFAKAVEVQRELNVSLVIYFYTDHCSDCRKLDDQYLSTAAVHEALQRSVAVRINPEYGPEELLIAQRYAVTSYPAFLIMDNESARPRNVQPFRQDGNNLTPYQFARACEEAMSWLPIPPKVTRDESREQPARATSRAVMNATHQSRRAQIVEVPSGTALSPTDTKSNPLPAIDAVLTKYVDAIGGREAQERIKSRVIKGTVQLSGLNSRGQLNIYAKAPNKSLTVMNVEPMGQVKHGFDGCTVWNVGDTTGSQTMTGAALSPFASDADFYREIKLPELYPGLKLVAKVKDKDREFYMVEGNSRFGGQEVMFFDVQSGLLTGRDLTQQTLQGPIRVEMRYSEWREVDGVKLPFKITQSMPNLNFVFTVTDVKHNVAVDDKVFEKPL